MLDNKKFLKEISNILTAADKAKKVVLSEMDKIDEKYRKMAEEEKKKLNAILANLNEQIKLYSPMVNDDDTVQDTEESADVPEETTVPEEPKVVDEIFPENNESSEEPVEEPVEPSPVPEAIESDEADDWSSSDDEASEEKQESNEDDDDKWPEYTTEW